MRVRHFRQNTASHPEGKLVVRAMINSDPAAIILEPAARVSVCRAC
jgi:hypothetical protein